MMNMAGRQGNNRIVWQQWQVDYLKENFNSMTAQQLSDAIGIKRTKVREMCYSLGLKKIELEYWTADQISYLVGNYKSKGDTELAEIFNQKWHKAKGWTKKHIEKKRMYMKLKRTKAEINSIKERNVRLGYFAICPVKAWKTRGGPSPDGSKRMWLVCGAPVMVIKVNGRYVHYSRYLYEQAIGKIPRNVLVRLKDGDPYHVTVDNLLLVTRKEHAILNSKSRNNLSAKKVKVQAKIKYQISQIKKTDNDYAKQVKRS